MNKLLGIALAGGGVVLLLNHFFPFIPSLPQEVEGAAAGGGGASSTTAPALDVRSRVWAAIRAQNGAGARFPDLLTYDQWNYYHNIATGSWAGDFSNSGIGDRAALISFDRWVLANAAGLAGIRGGRR